MYPIYPILRICISVGRRIDVSQVSQKIAVNRRERRGDVSHLSHDLDGFRGGLGRFLAPVIRKMSGFTQEMKKSEKSFSLWS